MAGSLLKRAGAHPSRNPTALKAWNMTKCM
jgi:hypothetical protein